MQSQQSLSIHLKSPSGDTLRIENVLFEVTFFTHGTVRYRFFIGSTDSMGILRASYDDIERIRRRNAEQFIMDYNTPLEECDDLIEVAAPSESALRRIAENVTKIFGASPDWSLKWPANCKVTVWPSKISLGNGLTVVPMTAELVTGM